MKYEIIVVGGGHAGCEASGIAAKKGHKTAMILMNKKNNNCECLQNIDIVLLPHPAAQINGSFRFTLNYMRVAATLYNNKIIDEETYLNKCIKYAEISHVL